MGRMIERPTTVKNEYFAYWLILSVLSSVEQISDHLYYFKQTGDIFNQEFQEVYDYWAARSIPSMCESFLWTWDVRNPDDTHRAVPALFVHKVAYLL